MYAPSHLHWGGGFLHPQLGFRPGSPYMQSGCVLTGIIYDMNLQPFQWSWITLCAGLLQLHIFKESSTILSTVQVGFPLTFTDNSHLNRCTKLPQILLSKPDCTYLNRVLKIAVTSMGTMIKCNGAAKHFSSRMGIPSFLPRGYGRWGYLFYTNKNPQM